MTVEQILETFNIKEYSYKIFYKTITDERKKFFEVSSNSNDNSNNFSMHLLKMIAEREVLEAIYRVENKIELLIDVNELFVKDAYDELFKLKKIDPYEIVIWYDNYPKGWRMNYTPSEQLFRILSRPRCVGDKKEFDTMDTSFFNSDYLDVAKIYLMIKERIICLNDLVEGKEYDFLATKRKFRREHNFPKLLKNGEFEFKTWDKKEQKWVN